MRRLLITLAILFTILTPGSASAASDPSLYFEDAVFDYYLEKTDTGTKLKVKETLTAIFSNHSTSHGLVRVIPYTNQNGRNITLDDLDLTVTRNGIKEPIAKTTKEDGYYKVNLGSSSVTVQGKQVYVLEYEFQNVITEYDSAGKDISGQGNADHQELYWDTNGTGWANVFNSLTANVHFASDYPVELPAYCYTGRKGSNAKNCTVEQTSDGFTFKTTAPLGSYENLTFDLEFPAGAFAVPISYNYTFIIATVAAALLGFGAVHFSIKKYQKYAKENRQFAENLLAAPQYLPPKDLTVAEAGHIWLGNGKPTETATILELATAHKIELIAEETTSKITKSKKTTWKIHVLDTKDLTGPQETVLKILSTGLSVPAVGEVIEIKKRTATSTLASLSESYKTRAVSLLKTKRLLNAETDRHGKRQITEEGTFGGLCNIALIAGSLALAFFYVDGTVPALRYGNLIGITYLPWIILAIVIVTEIFVLRYGSLYRKYSALTPAGLEVSNYLDGLKLYIEMAETERIAFNQSAKSAPKNSAGLVKLYEKLLPYACLFGLEKTWLSEIQKYYEDLNYSPDWYSGTDILTFTMLNSLVTTTSSTIASNTNWHSSSSSSGFSGGGGGGFSGGGGGGGGGGSW